MVNNQKKQKADVLFAPFSKLRNERITKQVAQAKPFILDIANKVGDEVDRCWFQAFTTLREALLRAKEIFADPDFKGQLFEMNGVPTLAVHVLGKNFEVINNEVNVWEELEWDIDVQPWQVALFECLPVEKQNLDNYLKIDNRHVPMTVQEFGSLLIA